MTRSEFCRTARRAGWGVELTNGGRLRLLHPAASMPVFIAATPGDRRRWCHNARALMRRALRAEVRRDR